MTRELQFRKDIIAGFSLIIPNWCKHCEKGGCEYDICLYFKAASAGHLNIIKEWLRKLGEKAI